MKSRRDNFQPKANEHYRSVPESTIVQILLLAGWAVEVDAGQRHWAEGESYDALETWIAKGLGYRLAPDGQRMFDPAEVVNFLKWAGLTGRDNFWLHHYVKTGRALVNEFRREQVSGDCRTDYQPTRFRMTLRRTFNLRDSHQGVKLRLRAPLPLVGNYLCNRTIKPLPVTDCDAVISIQAERMEVRFPPAGNRTATIGADASFVATPSTGGYVHPSLSSSELYLRKVEGFIRVTPRVEALAASLSGECRSDRETVAAFWAYMIDELICGIIRYGEVAAPRAVDWVLDQGWYDCQLGSALLVSLCRARGIPARVVGGHLLYRLAPTNHYWAEVWIDGTGWCPFDLLCWDLSEGGLDPAWRNIFAGQVDYRAVTQCFPLAFIGPMSVQFPSSWHMVQAIAGNCVEVAFLDANDGSLIYRDHIAVENLGTEELEQATED
jgi:hypothetical protein